MAYSRTADFTVFPRWPAAQWRTELEAVRDELMGGLANADVANSTFGLQNLAQPRNLSPIYLRGAASSETVNQGAPYANDQLPPDDPAGPLGHVMSAVRIARDCVLRAVDLHWAYVATAGGTTNAEQTTALSLDIAVSTNAALNLAINRNIPSNDPLSVLTSRLSQRLDIYEPRISDVTPGGLVPVLTIEDRRRLDQRTSPTLAGGWIPAGAWIFLIAYLASSHPQGDPFTHTIIPFNELTATVWVEMNHRT